MDITVSRASAQSPVDISDLIGDTSPSNVVTFPRHALAAFHGQQRWTPRPDGRQVTFKPDSAATFHEASSAGKPVRVILGGGLSAITLHNCAVNGQLESWASEIVDTLDSYTETVNGNVHIYLNLKPCNFALKAKKPKYKMTEFRLTLTTADGDCPVGGSVVRDASIKGLTSEKANAVIAIAKKSKVPLKLDVGDNGKIKQTLDNASNILSRHERMRGVFAYDQFFDRTRVMRQPDGEHFKGEHWRRGTVTDAHEADTRAWLSASSQYGGMGTSFTKGDVHDAMNRAGRENAFHPIQQWFESLPEWDGEPRMNCLFIDYLGCPDTHYHRQAAVMWMVAAVARVYEPGHKFDYMPIIEGPQGARKSTFVKALGGEWAGDPDLDWSNPQKLMEQTAGHWIIEVGELASMNKAETTDLKSAISKTEDTSRMAYATNAITRKRQFVLIGTTNDSQYLRDPTGNRRFWPIKCNKTMADPIDIDSLLEERDQIWAEALDVYFKWRSTKPQGDLPLTLTGEAIDEASALQTSRMTESAEESLAGQIEAWLDTPLGVEFDDLDGDVPQVYRNATCIAQIWREMMGRDGAPLQVDATRIGKAFSMLTNWERSANGERHPDLHSRYGKTRVYTRKAQPEIC
ncbi:virulence-associated E family protein [Agrobacterium pusense]|uniref:virulence-associated E family protein n=1 Tax=Agrobacterium pusense TaxID=648995 RepID=UPI0013007D36|nr:virulence-associated E family protein [Agrobacterium pusense]